MAQYTSLSVVKATLGIADATDDGVITTAIDSASAMIEEHCGRRFDKDPNTAAGAAGTSTRAYRIYPGTTRLEINDVDPTGPAPVFTWTGTVASTGSSTPGLGPLNAGLDGLPLTHMLMLDNAGLPTDEKLLTGIVNITARHGWPAVPAEVAQAALIQAVRLVSRRHSPYGIAGSPEVGSEMRLMSRLDPDVEALVRPLIRRWWVA